MERLSHILIIDDDLTNNVFTQIILEDANISDTVSVCQSVPEALDFLHNITQSSTATFPDMILLDICMPSLDGFDFLEQYYALNYHKRYSTIISMFSTSEQQEYQTQLKKYGVVVGFINKPLSMPTLQELLARHTGGHTEV